MTQNKDEQQRTTKFRRNMIWYQHTLNICKDKPVLLDHKSQP